MKKLIFATLILTIAMLSLNAQTRKQESIKRLFVLMKQDSLMQRTLNTIPLFDSFQNSMQLKDSAYQARSREAIKTAKKLMSELYSKIQADMIAYYDKYFTQKEIDDFIRFYKSLSGQKLIEITPLITKEMMTSFQTKYFNDIITSVLKSVIPAGKMNIQKPILKPDSASIAAMKAEYLDVDTTKLEKMTHEQKSILKKAKERTERYVSFENNEYVLRVTQASELNMSNRLFEKIKAQIRMSNMMLNELAVMKKPIPIDGPENNVAKDTMSQKTRVNANPKLVTIDKMPEFPGGINELMKYISENLHYPKLAQLKGIQGKVLVSFLVSKTGKVENPVIVKGLSDEINNEALRIVQSLPDWIPGENKGQKVSVHYTLPVIFKL